MESHFFVAVYFVSLIRNILISDSVINTNIKNIQWVAMESLKYVIYKLHHNLGNCCYCISPSSFHGFYFISPSSFHGLWQFCYQNSILLV